ncbi:hypothetical protein tb265_42060 [Gemmatimonadetes bacterium T265]|nr:hypothetical protein tb265_42060 [Gemmatimonadetes bacterium T265]
MLAAAWCAVALGAPLALPAAVARVAAGAAAAAPGADAACAGMMTADGMRHAAPHGSRSGDHQCCVCFGSCCHAAAALVADPPRALVAAVAALALRPTPPAIPPVYHPSAPEHARPPSVGPPVGLPA